jgi:hypothetical protein
MSRIAISDINVEMIEVSEVDAAAVVGGDGTKVIDFLYSLAVLGEGFATKQLNAIVQLHESALSAIGGL